MEHDSAIINFFQQLRIYFNVDFYDSKKIIAESGFQYSYIEGKWQKPVQGS